MKIIITEEQYNIYEESQSSLFEIEPDYLHRLCKKSKDVFNLGLDFVR